MEEEEWAGEGESIIKEQGEQSPCADLTSVNAMLRSGCCSEGIFGRKKKCTRSREEEKLDHCLGVGRLCGKCLGGGSWRERSHGSEKRIGLSGPDSGCVHRALKRLLCSPSIPWRLRCAAEPLPVALMGDKR